MGISNVPNQSEIEKKQDNSISVIEESTNPMEVPRRIAVFPQQKPARFQEEKLPEKLVMTFPNLIIREVVYFQIVVIVLVLAAIFFDAPLEELANPHHTPNPAKAPWYFLGIQELLHSFPPIVAGVIIPTMVVIALIVIPYMNINIKPEGLWQYRPRQTLFVFSLVVFSISGICVPFHAYSIVIPSIILYSIAVIPYFFHRDHGWINWLGRRSLSEWIMSWFVIVLTILTIIGVYFRGPGWSWVWPWN